jgi:hypothetical protein
MFPTSTNDPRFFQRFCEEQWRFSAPVFLYNDTNLHFEANRILPIISKDKLAGGGSAVLHQIKLHKAYNKLHYPNSFEQVSLIKLDNPHVATLLTPL